MKKVYYILMISLLLIGCANDETNEINTEITSVGDTFSTEQSTLENMYVELETELKTESEVQKESIYTYSEVNQTMYAKQSINVRDLPCADGNKLGELLTDQEVIVTGQCNETSWYRIVYGDSIAYVSNSYLVDVKPDENKLSNSVPERYKYCYDIDRDGLVSDAEIDAFDRRFYGEEPTTDNMRIVLKTGYNQVLSLVNGYTGGTYYAVMVKVEDGYSYAAELLDRFLLDKGLRALNHSGGSIDEEREYVSCDNIVPIDCMVRYNAHGQFIEWNCGWPDIAEEVYGYSGVDIGWKCVGVGTEAFTIVPEPEGGHISYCDCGGGFEVVFTFEQMKAIVGIQ